MFMLLRTLQLKPVGPQIPLEGYTRFGKRLILVPIEIMFK